MPARLKLFLPLALFALLALFLFRGLGLDPRELPSALIDRPLPEFSLPRLGEEQPVSRADVVGRTALFNVWATWCVSCRAEHPLLMALARQGVTIYGLDYKDDREDARRWLARFGDPYVANAFDADGRVGIDWGVYGTPETFVIDQQGIIRHKHIGPLTEDAIQGEILPLIKKLKEEKG